jgi:DNA-binding XRE family transcriptional regulator
MKLKDYLEQSHQPVAEFAKKIGASRQAVYVFLGDGKKPSLEVAVRIEQVTGGLVPVESWLPEPKRARRSA